LRRRAELVRHFGLARIVGGRNKGLPAQVKLLQRERKCHCLLSISVYFWHKESHSFRNLVFVFNLKCGSFVKMVPPSLRPMRKDILPRSSPTQHYYLKQKRIASRIFGLALVVLEHWHMVLDKESARSGAEFLLQL
jgi:hypothetical protein